MPKRTRYDRLFLLPNYVQGVIDIERIKTELIEWLNLTEEELDEALEDTIETMTKEEITDLVIQKLWKNLGNIENDTKQWQSRHDEIKWDAR